MTFTETLRKEIDSYIIDRWNNSFPKTKAISVSLSYPCKKCIIYLAGGGVFEINSPENMTLTCINNAIHDEWIKTSPTLAELGLFCDVTT